MRVKRAVGAIEGLRHFLLIVAVLGIGVCHAETTTKSVAEHYTPLKVPDLQKFTEAEARRFDKVAKSRPTIYATMADYLVARFNLAERAGIGIDIAGATGDLTLELAARTKNFYWINSDINSWYALPFYEDARQRQVAARTTFIFADACALPFGDNYADLITSRGAFQFWGDLELAIKEIYRVLKPGGRAFIGRGFTPNMPESEVRELLGSGRAGGPKYTPNDQGERLRTLAQRAGAKEIEVLLHQPQDAKLRYGVWLSFSK